MHPNARQRIHHLMKYDPYIESAPRTDEAPRSSGRAAVRGWRRRCPNCGGGPLMDGYLTVRDACAACGEELHHHRADDLPAWATILIVGKILVASMVTLEVMWSPSVWVHWVLWPMLTLAMSLWLLPRIKGVIVGLQWAWRLHGFDRRP